MISHRSSENRHPKTAFTLVELLVVITIIGILIALLLPAVQAAREAARRMQCSNNLKQLALAVLSYENAYARFPAGSDICYTSGGEEIYNNWTVRVMPYMELSGIYDHWDFKQGYGIAASVNGPLMQIHVPAFCCPSDTTLTATYKTEKEVRSNYVACFSPFGTMIEPGAGLGRGSDDASLNPSVNQTPRSLRALFNFNVYRDISVITDGLSNTVAISEGSGTQDDLRGCWWHPWGAQYTHHNGPNTTIPDGMYGGGGPGYCDSTPDAPCTLTAGWGTLDVAARSKHPGGVVAARVDGSIDFYSNQIDLDLWQALGSIDGGPTERTP